MYDKFKKLMDGKGVKASDVSKATKISTSTLTDWKKGRYEPKADKLQKIADYFGVPISYFYDDVDKAWEEHKESIDNLDVADLLDMMCDAILKRVESDFDKESYKSNMKRYSDFLISEMKNGNEHKD